MRLFIQIALLTQCLACAHRSDLDAPGGRSAPSSEKASASEKPLSSPDFPCEPVGCKSAKFLIEDELHPFPHNLKRKFTPDAAQQFVTSSILFKEPVGFASVEDRRSYVGDSFWKVTAVEHEATVYRLFFRSGWPKVPSDIPYTLFGPFRAPPGVVREVLGAEMEMVALRRVGVPGDVQAFRTRDQEYRSLTIRCGCEQAQNQDWYWSQDRWCLARSVPETLSREPIAFLPYLSSRETTETLSREEKPIEEWCGDGGPSKFDHGYVPLDALLCPPDEFPFESINPPLCWEDRWLSTGAGISLQKNLTLPMLVGRREIQYGENEYVSTGFIKPSNLHKETP